MAVRLLDRYLLRELLLPLAYCLGGFLIFYVAFDLIFEIGRFQEGHLLFLDVVEYYIVTLPEILSDQVIPVSLLLACLYALTSHNRHNEFTAMRAAGVSLWRLSLPYLAVGMAGGLVVFALNELYVPRASEESKDILERRKNPGQDRDWIRRLDFHNEADRRHWNIARFNRATSEMTGPTVTWETPDGSSHTVFAKRAVYTNDLWRFYNVERWDRSAGAGGFPTQTSNVFLDIPFSETPASIRTEIKVGALSPTEAAKGPQLSIRELHTYLHWHPHLDREKRWPSLMTQLQGRIAAPFTCLAVVLIALPFGARGGRHNVFVGVAGSIFICFAYFILQRVSVGLGVAGYLAPVVAAWLPNLLFGGAGVALMFRLR
jgi:lipopolysaccharide export system permease protein